MANLTVDTLKNIVQTGDIEGLFKGTLSKVAENSVVTNEMNLQGLGSSSAQAGNGKNFSDLLMESMDKVNLHQHQADTAIKELVAGRNKNIHETMLTIERADTSLKMMMQVRNKILDAYREIMRMQV